MNIIQLIKLSITLILLVMLLASCISVGVEPPIVPVVSGLALQLAPNEGEPGTEVTVTGSGWTPRTKMEVDFNTAGFGLRSREVITTVTDDQGRFETIVNSPTGLFWQQPDKLVVTARAPSTGQQVSTLFTNLVSSSTGTSDPAISLTPPSPTATPPLVGSTATARVTAYSLNTRRGPGTKFGIIKAIDRDTNFTVLGQDGTSSWLQIRLSDGAEGWVARAYTDFTGTVPVASVFTVPLPIPTLPAFSGGWKGEYFDNRTLSGAPVLVRQDGRIGFDWGDSAPTAQLPVDNFSVRWTRALTLPAGSYLFTTYADDGVRVWLNDKLIVDRWREGSAEISSAEQKLDAGQHRLRIEYFEAQGNALAKFWWQPSGDYPDWRGEYYANPELRGTPVLVRNDKQIAFDWGDTAPSDKLPNNRFSARWTRTQPFGEGLYRFTIQADDGVRLYVDNTLIVDAWQDGKKTDLSLDYKLSAGFHNLRLEYYENGGDALVNLQWERKTAFPDWLAQYWPNRNQQGAPALIRNDAKIDFNWGANAPASAIPSDNFSARWSRTQFFDANTYRFYLVADDGVRLYIDGVLLIDAWMDGVKRDLTVEHPLAAGSHTIQVDYYEHSGDARIQLGWEKVLSPIYPDWKGEYFANITLTGVPALTRNDRNIDFLWNTQAPAHGLPTDNFSVRWSRTVQFTPGVYRFYAQSDDGIRVFINGSQVLNAWFDQGAADVYTTDLTMNGTNRIVVEYYDNTGGARAQFYWNRLSVLPTSNPSPTRTPTPTSTPVPQATATPTSTPTPTTTPIPGSEATATPTVLPSPTATPTPTPTIQPSLGTVEGAICWPDEISSGINVYLLNAVTNQVTIVSADYNQAFYETLVAPGSYIAYAWSQYGLNGGAYTEAVACGLGVSCTDHALRIFDVVQGITSASIDICDWSVDVQPVIPTPTVIP